MQAVDDDWARVAAWLERQLALQGVSLRSLESSHKVNYRTTKGLLEGQPVTRRATLTNLANALGYEGDAIDRLLRGQEPVKLPTMDGDVDRRLTSVERELAEVRADVAEILRRLGPGSGGP